MERESDTETIPQDRGFTLFPELPAEIRLMIWEAALPEEVHPRSKICEIWDLKRGRDIIVTTPRATAMIAFLACCYESRHFALKNGSLVPLKSLVPGEVRQKNVWMDRNVEIVFIPFEPRYLDRIITLPPNVQVLADTIGNTYDPVREGTVGKYITKWRIQGTINIDTLYFGLVDELPMNLKTNRDGRRIHVWSPRFGGINMIWPRECEIQSKRVQQNMIWPKECEIRSEPVQQRCLKRPLSRTTFHTSYLDFNSIQSQISHGLHAYLYRSALSASHSAFRIMTAGSYEYPGEERPQTPTKPFCYPGEDFTAPPGFATANHHSPDVLQLV